MHIQPPHYHSNFMKLLSVPPPRCYETGVTNNKILLLLWNLSLFSPQSTIIIQGTAATVVMYKLSILQARIYKGLPYQEYQITRLFINVLFSIYLFLISM